MKVLVVDIGGTNVKLLATGQPEPKRFPSGPGMTPAGMVAGVRKLAGNWKYDAVSIGYPGRVLQGQIASEPHNLAAGWAGFDFTAAFQRPVKIINDAAMQALGSHRGGTMFFLGLGPGLGSALVAEGQLVPMELAHLPYKKGTYEDYLGARGIQRLGNQRWRKQVAVCVARLISAFQLDEVVLGGATPRNWKPCPKVAGLAIIPMPFSVAFACGTRPISGADATNAGNQRKYSNESRDRGTKETRVRPLRRFS